MRVTSLYPLLTTTDVAASSAFFVEHLAFEVTYRSDWYVSLRTTTEPRFELAFIEPGHASVPSRWRDSTAAGVIVTVEVDDADAAHARFRAAGADIHVPLRDEPHGQRHFITSDPTGILVDVVQPTPPAPGFADGYLDPPAGGSESPA